MILSKKIYGDYKEYPEKVLQFGEGNFLRGFIDWQIDIMNKKANFNGGVVAVQPLKTGRVVPKLRNQDGLYTVCLQGIKNNHPVKENSVVSCISRCINPYEEYDAYLNMAKKDELRFVISNTTEAGIAFDEKDSLKDGCQNSFPGKLTALLYERFKFFKGDKDKGLVIIPCELIDKNGDKLKAVIEQYANLWNLEIEFFNWINECNTFCNTLVDRIVPGFPKDNEMLERELGYKDDLMVVGEQYYLWVIEGPSWLSGELPFEKAGLNVKLVNDVTPYRARKVRILNGAHSALVPVAYLYGLNTVREAIDDKTVGKFIRNVIYDEIIPTLVSSDIPQNELVNFADAVIERFKNPFIHHYLMSIALNSMSKFETRDLPSIIEYYEAKGSLPNNLVFSLAALIAFYKGKRGEEEIKLADDSHILNLFNILWGKWDGSDAGLKNIVSLVLGCEKNWNMNLNTINGLNEMVSEYLIDIENLGIETALKKLLCSKSL